MRNIPRSFHKLILVVALVTLHTQSVRAGCFDFLKILGGEMVTTIFPWNHPASLIINFEKLNRSLVKREICSAAAIKALSDRIASNNRVREIYDIYRNQSRPQSHQTLTLDEFCKMTAEYFLAHRLSYLEYLLGVPQSERKYVDFGLTYRNISAGSYYPFNFQKLKRILEAKEWTTFNLADESVAKMPKTIFEPVMIIFAAKLSHLFGVPIDKEESSSKLVLAPAGKYCIRESAITDSQEKDLSDTAWLRFINSLPKETLKRNKELNWPSSDSLKLLMYQTPEFRILSDRQKRALWKQAVAVFQEKAEFGPFPENQGLRSASGFSDFSIATSPLDGP